MTTIDDMFAELEGQPFIEETGGGYTLTFAGTIYCLRLLCAGGFISMDDLQVPIPIRDTDVDEYLSLNETSFNNFAVDVRGGIANYMAMAKKASEEQPEKYKQIESDVFLMILFKLTLDKNKPH
jgi:hypothetical protein